MTERPIDWSNITGSKPFRMSDSESDMWSCEMKMSNIPLTPCGGDISLEYTREGTHIKQMAVTNYLSGGMVIRTRNTRRSGRSSGVGVTGGRWWKRR